MPGSMPATMAVRLFYGFDQLDSANDPAANNVVNKWIESTQVPKSYFAQATALLVPSRFIFTSRISTARGLISIVPMPRIRNRISSPPASKKALYFVLVPFPDELICA